MHTEYLLMFSGSLHKVNISQCYSESTTESHQDILVAIQLRPSHIEDIHRSSILAIIARDRSDVRV